jgi:WD40 repeat protein
MMTYTISTAADKVAIWDSISISQESSEVPPAPVYSLPSNENPLWTCWAGNFEILAALFPNNIQLIHRKDYVSEVIETGSGCNSALAMGYKSNKTLYYAADKVIKIYDIQNKKELNSLTGHSAKIKTLSVSNDDQRIVAGAVDGSVMVHSLKHGTKSKLNSPFNQVIQLAKFRLLIKWLFTILRNHS